MSTYYFIQSEKNVSIWKKYSWAFISASIAILKIIDYFNSAKKSSLFIGLIFAINAVIAFFFTKKKTTSYLKIDTGGVEWLLDDFQHPKMLTWNEIKRVKFEEDGVSLYQESSFCEFISLNGFEQSNLDQLKQELIQYAIVT